MTKSGLFGPTKSNYRQLNLYLTMMNAADMPSILAFLVDVLFQERKLSSRYFFQTYTLVPTAVLSNQLFSLR
jgi:hypothetical protein